MPKIARLLNDKQVKAIAASSDSGLYPVGGVAGLSLQVRATENRRSASWILRIKIGTKRRNLGLGGFYNTTLSRIRKQAEELRFKIKFEGLDPFKLREEAKQSLLEDKARQANVISQSTVVSLVIS